jgi:opacity protein-like surface antigen
MLVTFVLAACGDAAARAAPTSPNFSTAPTVAIFGPANVIPNRICEWYGRISYGTAPYTWTWSRTGGTGTATALSPTEQSYHARPAGAIVISLTITDAEGRTATASKTVNTSVYAQECFI